MGTRDKRIDAYILKSADFAIPVLTHLRELVHVACADVEEKVKWGMPFFDYKGEGLCNMASFRHHCAFGFWKASLMKDKKLAENAKKETAMGHFGKITSLEDLPSDAVIIRYIKEAMKLNDAGIKVERKKPAASKEVTAPDYFLKALKSNRIALKTFNLFSPSAKREYITWIVDAKNESTRTKRIVQAVAWISDGKQRNWKYMKK